jgi:hypothetical protein
MKKLGTSLDSGIRHDSINNRYPFAPELERWLMAIADDKESPSVQKLLIDAIISVIYSSMPKMKYVVYFLPTKIQFY